MGTPREGKNRLKSGPRVVACFPIRNGTEPHPGTGTLPYEGKGVGIPPLRPPVDCPTPPRSYRTNGDEPSGRTLGQCPHRGIVLEQGESAVPGSIHALYMSPDAAKSMARGELALRMVGCQP